MAYEWLSAQETTLRCAETDVAPLQIGALCLFEAGPLVDADGRLRLADLRRHAEAGLRNVPRLRQLMVTPPFGAGRPAWVDDPHFDIANHVRLAALPPPRGREELRQFVRRVIETPLDRSRPLWEFWVVERVEGGRVAIVVKFSHVAADGIAVLRFVVSLLDPRPTEHPTDHVEAWTPAPHPGRPRLLAAALADGAVRRYASFAGLAGAIGRPDRLVTGAAKAVRAARAMVASAPPLPMTRPVGRRRDFGWLSLPLDDLHAVAHARGVTLNDVVLALVAEALAADRTRSGTPGDGACPRVIVPVSTHGADGSDRMANSFSLMVADLPVDRMPSVTRLDRVHDELQRCKRSGQADLVPALFAVGGVIPPVVLRSVAPRLLRRQPFVNLAVTNLAGSPVPLYLFGSRLLEVFPFISLTANLGVIVGVLSHDRGLGVGITADPDLVRDIDTLTGDIAAAAAGLIAATSGRAPRRPPSARIAPDPHARAAEAPVRA